MLSDSKPATQFEALRRAAERFQEITLVLGESPCSKNKCQGCDYEYREAHRIAVSAHTELLEFIRRDEVLSSVGLDV